MKIWIDLTNAPHINFFKPFVRRWEDEGHEIIFTARNLSNTIDLIDQNGWRYIEIGGHAGKSKIKKLLYFPKRVILLYTFLIRHKLDIGISHSSFYSPIVCKLLKIPSIYLNDNEHAKGNYLAFKFATVNMLPEFLSNKANQLKWLNKYTIKFYPGLKEGIYLSKANIEARNNNLQSHAKKKFFIRLEPRTAEYYKGDSDFMDSIIQKLNINHEVVILPRSKGQINHFKNYRFKGVYVCEKPMLLQDIARECTFFIGAGGSMSRELAFLGVPTLSVYQGEILSVDRYLIDNGIMQHSPSPKTDDIEALVNNRYSSSNMVLLQKGLEAFELIDKELKELVNNKGMRKK